MLFVVVGWLVVLNLILEFMFASEIQYETTKIHSRHPPLHFPKDLLQHLLLSSWEHSYTFTLRATSQFIACEQLVTWCSSTNSCLSNTLPLHQSAPWTLLLLILSCWWGQFWHTLSMPGNTGKTTVFIDTLSDGCSFFRDSHSSPPIGSFFTSAFSSSGHRITSTILLSPLCQQ